MCKHVLSVFAKLAGYNKRIMDQELTRIFGSIPVDYKEMMSKVVYTAYLSGPHTSESYKNAAKIIALELGSTHFEGSIDEIFQSYLDTFTEYTGSKIPQFQSEGGSRSEEIALEALQCRIRMVVSYISGQLLPFSLNRTGFLIVLSCTSLEQNILGYHTKYGNSSGDINPIGCISKIDLKLMINSLINEYPSLENVLAVELERKNELNPLRKNVEDDMGLTAEEIRTMTKFRKIEKYGPLTMFFRCCEVWGGDNKITADKVKRFFVKYANNRHKMTVLTPMMHMDSSGIDDNRYDLRQFLYNVNWTAQFDSIDQALID